MWKNGNNNFEISQEKLSREISFFKSQESLNMLKTTFMMAMEGEM